MPVHFGKDKEGDYYQWGKTGKKYYIKQYGQEGALKKAREQEKAIRASGWKGDSKMRLICVKDSAYLDDFENVIIDIIQCITVLNIGPGSEPIKFLRELSSSIGNAKKDWKSKVEPKLKDVSFDKRDIEDIYKKIDAAFKDLAKVSPLSGIWKQYGGLGNDKGSYSEAYHQLAKDIKELRYAIGTFV